MSSPISSLLLMLGLWLTLATFCCAGGRSFETRPSPNAVPILITAPALVAEYEANEVAADERYKGRKLQVSGVVTSIAKDILDDKYVTLSSGQEYGLTSVQCFFDDTEGKYLGNLTKGRSLTVECTCDGKFGNVLLKDCVIKAVG